MEEEEEEKKEEKNKRKYDENSCEMTKKVTKITKSDRDIDLFPCISWTRELFWAKASLRFIFTVASYLKSQE